MQYWTPRNLHVRAVDRLPSDTRGCGQAALRDHGSAQRLLLPLHKCRKQAHIEPVLALLQCKFLLSTICVLVPNPACNVVLMWHAYLHAHLHVQTMKNAQIMSVYCVNASTIAKMQQAQYHAVIFNLLIHIVGMSR